MGKHSGRLELTWTDKDKALLSSGDGKYDYTFVDPSDYRVSEVRLLHEVERVDAATPADRPEGLPEPTMGNLLITGDAMHVLDSLAKIPEYANQYLGQVKLVYIDPPFNTGQAFANYEDNIEHSVWLTMLRDRLRQIKPLLATDGSVWVHLDDVELHRCRAVLDEEFGAENFRAEVVWQRADSPRSDVKGFSKSHDTILVYRKTIKWLPNASPRTAAMNARFTSPDDDPQPWFDDNPTAPGARSNDETSIFAVQHPVTGALLYPPNGRHWAVNQVWMLEQMRGWANYELRDIADYEARARVRHLKSEKARRGVPAIMLSDSLEVAEKAARRRYAAGNWPDLVLRSGGTGGLGRKARIPATGRVPETWWSNGEVGHNRQAKAEIKALFPDKDPFATPKPERLLQRIIQIATIPGDIVLDCFAGSGTTAAVAHKMGRRWVTSELLSETAAEFTKPRLERVVHGKDPGGITSTETRVAADGVTLPEGVSADEAQNFSSLLGKIVKRLDDPVKGDVAKLLRAAVKTHDVRTTNWHGGGGFTRLQVGPSMFVEFDDMILLADWATQGDLARAMCAQIGVSYEPDGIFAARRGRTRIVVVDGMVGASTVAAVLDRLEQGEAVEMWATQIEDGAAAVLRDARPGSRLDPIPDAVLDNYRRKAASTSPFGGARATQEGNA